MSIFIKPYTREYSVIDPIKSEFDSSIIVNNKIKPELREKILKATEKISDYVGHEIDKIWILGSLLTHQYSEDSDLDVTFFLKDSLNPEDYKELNKTCADKFNDKLFVEKHPINFFFAKPKFLKYKSDAIYDLINENWIKKPEILSEDDVEEIIRNCSSLDEFNTILEEYTNLKNLLENFEGDSSQITEILKQTVKVSKMFNELKDIRRKDFEKKPDPNLPSANFRCSNIIFKLLEQYGLGDIVNDVSEFISFRLKN